MLNPRAVRRDPARARPGFAAAMAGRTFTRAERRGKYMWFALDDDEALLAHLGMSGQLLVGEPDRPLSPHVRARFTFTDGGPDLRFTDQRTFGHLMMAPLALAIKAPARTTRSRRRRPRARADRAHRARPARGRLRRHGDFAAQASTRRKTGVKRALLDQSLISGIGNIYADEALWRAKLHWARPTETLRKAEVLPAAGSGPTTC